MYGWRLRLGRLTPSASVNGEQEWARVLPDGMIVVTARVYIEEVTAPTLEVMMTQLERAAKEVASAGVHVVMQCGTPGVALRGRHYEQDTITLLRRVSGRPCSTMATAVAEALTTLEVRKVAVATPYLDEVGRGVAQFFVDRGVEVKALRNLGIKRNADIGTLPPEAAYRVAREAAADAGPIDAVFISCGNLRTFEIIQPLEEDLGVPVVSSNQAALWKALRLAGYTEALEDLGALLQL